MKTVTFENEEFVIPDDMVIVPLSAEFCKELSGSLSVIKSSIKYMGNRNVTCIPKEDQEYFPYVYKETYADLLNLTTPPNIPKNYNYRVFSNCSNLNPSWEWCKEYLSKSGVTYGPVFKDTGSKHILSIPKWFRYDVDVAIIKRICQDDNDSNVSSIQEYIDENIDSLEDGEYIFEDATAVRVKTISAASEVDGKILAATTKFAYTSMYTEKYITFAGRASTIYKFSKDFNVNIECARLYRAFGFYLAKEGYQESIDAGSNSTLNFSAGKCGIDANCPIEAYNTVTLKGDGTELTLISHGQNPCIGPKTDDNLSYGRWSPAQGSLNEIILDNIHVTCKSDVHNFTIGSYGKESVPKITLLNGATLDCPEMNGTRVMVKSGAEGLQGSTKREKPAEYVMQRKTMAECFNGLLEDAEKERLAWCRKHALAFMQNFSDDDILVYMEDAYEKARRK